jgi:hypothetical protein
MSSAPEAQVRREEDTAAEEGVECTTGSGYENNNDDEERDSFSISETFHPARNDGFALIDLVETGAGKRLLHPMKILFPREVLQRF